jgi:hypothetical protein
MGVVGNRKVGRMPWKLVGLMLGTAQRLRRDGWTYRKIGEVFKMSGQGIHYRLNRGRKRT